MADNDQIMTGNVDNTKTDEETQAEADLPTDWLDVLNDPRMTPDNQEAKELCSRLKLAPPIDVIIE